MFAGYKPRNPLDFSDPWIISGTLLIAAGLGMRTWAAGLLQKKEKLATEGPYQLVRHPLYAGSIMMMFGFTVLFGHPINFVVTAILAFVLFGFAIRGEEKFLAAKFGAEWEQYIVRTGSIFPKRITFALRSSWSLKRWLANREYNAWLGSSLGWCGICAWYFA